MKKGLVYLGVSIVASLFIGCGDGDLNSDEISYNPKNIFEQVVIKDIDYKEYTVNVVDDPIIGAKVSAQECNTSIEEGNGTYKLTGCITKPKYISVEGGVMVTSEGNITQSFPLLLNTAQISNDDNFVVTPLTTLVATTDDNDTIESIATNLGLSKEDLFKDPREVNATDVNATDLAQKVNALFIQGTENGSIVNKTEFINVVRDGVKEKGNKFDEVADYVNTESQDQPDFFGFVMIPRDSVNSDSILEELHKTQNPTHLSFVGFVFDENFEANISVYKQDGTQISNVSATCDEYGHWTIEDTSGELNTTIYETNQTLTFEAVKSDNSDIVLKSSITTARLRELIEKQKKVTASKDNSLIISNITTATHAMLDKRGVFNSGVDTEAYDNNLTDIKTYYNDVVLKASATVKVIVDNNETENTYDLVKDNLGNNADNYNIPSSVDEDDVETMKTNIKNSTILKSQLYTINTPTIAKTDTENELTLEKVAKNENYTFYRIFAYENEDNELVREYSKITVVPGQSRYQKYQIVGEGAEWTKVIDVNSSISNFNDGDFVVTDNNGMVERFSLDKNNSVYVEDLNKEYNYYSIVQTIYENDGVTMDSRDTVIWVDDFDIVDAFRRLKQFDDEEGTTYYNDLYDQVRGLKKEDANSALNRYVKDFLNDVNEYFKD